jgi:Ca2+-binding RTX toxin-like protein
VSFHPARPKERLLVRETILLLATVVLGLLLAVGPALAKTVDCQAGGSYCVGTNNPDHITGSDERDHIIAFGGGDTVEARGGDDSVYGGNGEDQLSGEGGDDELLGGDEDDWLNGGGGDDELNGGEDDDRMFDRAENDFDIVWSGSGNDVIDVEDRDRRDHVHCGSGQDKVKADPGDDVASGCERVS